MKKRGKKKGHNKIKKIKKVEIKAIIFDVGGVLALPRQPLKILESIPLLELPKKHKNTGIHEYIAKKFQIVLDQWFDAIDSAYAGSMEGKISEKEVVEIIAKNLDISPKYLEKIVIKAYKKNFKQNNPLFRLAFNLKQKGYKIAVLSDQWHLSKKALMPKKLYDVFNELVISCDVGVRKPDPKIYKILLKRLKLKAEQTLFIDNRDWNLKPAKKLGMNTILFENNEQLFRDLLERGIVV